MEGVEITRSCNIQNTEFNSSMMKSNTYSLATDYSTYCLQHSKENTQGSVSVNIFEQKDLEFGDSKPISSQRKYEVVGWKELKNLQTKQRKDHKKTTRRLSFSKEPMEVRQISSRQSRRNHDDLLTKKEVLSTLPRKELLQTLPRKQAFETLPDITNKEPKPKLKTTKHGHWLTEFPGVSSPLETPSRSISRKKVKELKEFSVNRLKMSIESKDREWNHLLEKISRVDPKFPSVYRRIEGFRTQMEQKQKNAVYDTLPNQSSSKWEKVLRSSTKMDQLFLKKQPVRTFQGSDQFLATGKSKLRTEADWLNVKSEEGYEFKVIQERLDSIPEGSSTRR